MEPVTPTKQQAIYTRVIVGLDQNALPRTAGDVDRLAEAAVEQHHDAERRVALRERLEKSCSLSPAMIECAVSMQFTKEQALDMGKLKPKRPGSDEPVTGENLGRIVTESVQAKLAEAEADAQSPFPRPTR